MDKKLFKSILWIITYAALLVLIITNFDELRGFFANFLGLFTPLVLGFALGANMSLQQVAKGGVSGVVLGLITVIIGGVFNIFFDKLTPEEKQIVENAPRNSTELTSHEIGVLLLREKYILDKIKEYQALPPDQMITSSVMDMRVPGGRGKRKRDGANQQIGMYQKETPAQRILQLQEALNKIHGRILSAAAQMQKNEMDKLHLETEQQRIELLRIRATGEIGEPGDGDKDAVHE